MLYPSLNQLLKTNAEDDSTRKQCRYSLVIAVAKRAREIAEEAEANGEILDDRSVSLAVKDFEDKNTYFEEV